jgi:hypothetical protein
VSLFFLIYVLFQIRAYTYLLTFFDTLYNSDFYFFFTGFEFVEISIKTTKTHGNMKTTKNETFFPWQPLDLFLIKLLFQFLHLFMIKLGLYDYAKVHNI